MNKIARKIGVAVIALVTIVSVSGITPAVAQTATPTNIAFTEIGAVRAQISALLAQFREFMNQLIALQARIDRIAVTPPVPHAPATPATPATPAAPATPHIPPVVPFVVSLRSHLANISQGESAMLIWNTAGATNCRIITREAVTRRVIETRHVNLSGEIRVNPLLTTIYTLTCDRRDNMRETNSSEVTITMGTAIPSPTPAPAPISPTPPTSLVPVTQCRATGCSSQVCSDQDVITTCEFRPEFACFRVARCERQTGGQCGWTMTPELQACLTQHRSPQALIN